MVVFSDEQVVMIKSWINTKILKEGFEHITADDFMDVSVQECINLFLCIGINNSMMSMKVRGPMDFVRNGVNKFFRSTGNRRELCDLMFQRDIYKGKYLLAMDYYVAPAVFDNSFIDKSVLDAWALMTKKLVIKGWHGIQLVVEEQPERGSNYIKYRWIDRRVSKDDKKGIDSAKAKAAKKSNKKKK